MPGAALQAEPRHGAAPLRDGAKLPRRQRRLSLHITLVVLLTGFTAATWWQIDRALGGNGLSWAYVFEWPLFGLYAIYMWWQLIHDPVPAEERRARPSLLATYTSSPPQSPRTPRTPQSQAAAPDARARDEDDALAAYNDYLAALHARDRRRSR